MYIDAGVGHPKFSAQRESLRRHRLLGQMCALGSVEVLLVRIVQVVTSPTYRRVLVMNVTSRYKEEA